MPTDLTAMKPPLLSTETAFMSDFDGTLVELAPHPDAVSVSAGLAGWLHQLEKFLGTALAIVTGRRLSDVDSHLAPLQLMGAGAHGAEVRVAKGGTTTAVVAPLEQPLVAAIDAILTDLPGVWLENKTFALAAHFRDNPAAEAECMTRIQQVAAMFSDVEVFNGHCVIELRVRGVSKGLAVQSILASPAFSGRVPIFVGDDFADEGAFLAVQAAGGHGVKVGIGDSSAHYRLPDVAAVHQWICESLMQLRQES